MIGGGSKTDKKVGGSSSSGGGGSSLSSRPPPLLTTTRRRVADKRHVIYLIVVSWGVFFLGLSSKRLVAVPTWSSTPQDTKTKEEWVIGPTVDSSSSYTTYHVNMINSRIVYLDDEGMMIDDVESSSSFITEGGRREVYETKERRKRRKHPPDYSHDKSYQPAVRIVSVPNNSPNGTKSDCQPLEWQLKSYPTCNGLHEMNMMSDDVQYLGAGTLRSAWEVDKHIETSNNVVLKTLQLKRPECKFDHHHYEQHRRDALASERLTSSPHIVDIYGYCGQSCINEILKSNLENFHRGGVDRTNLERLRVAKEAAVALADVHTAVDGYYGTIVHRDVTHRNYLLTDDDGEEEYHVKLNDFNVGRLPEWDYGVGANRTCGFKKNDCTGYRSPEECGHGILTEKTDVYMLGNSLYFILTGHEPYTYPKHIRGKENVRTLIVGGHPSIIPSVYRKSKDIAVISLVKVIHSCWAYEKDDRPTSIEIAAELTDVYRNLSTRVLLQRDDRHVK